MGKRETQGDCSEQAVIAWLVETLHYPFDFSFDRPPPVDHGKLADYWNVSDNWQVTSEEARSCVYEEAGLTTPPTSGGAQ